MTRDHDAPEHALIAPPPPDAARRRLLTIAGAGALAATLSACGGGGGGSEAPAVPAAPAPGPGPAPSPPSATVKRGVAYDLKDGRDFGALAGPVGWWCNWALQPNAAVLADASITATMTHVPMLWNFDFDTAQVVAALKARPAVKHLLVLNEPNLTDQANVAPTAAAAQWPRYEDVARQTGVQLVGPAITWGTMAGFADPVVWMDAFIAAYRAANGGRDPRIDALAFHWYDYGLGGQLDRLAKYGKPFWVTEMANWHSQNDGAQIDSAAKQKAQMADMVKLCESRADVVRYAWFTGRWSPDPHFTSLLASPGALTELGQQYRALPVAS
ncbi:hypothetical protein CDN99_08035 [Roseateles aquatilis]|uniref:Asl1-like glycosyl hydrolase catalytic domain-containing protein n=1 Tax=Roseateles aquatilis TaxID=431061 RepID=A0A246JID0_9BURK|nr:glycosyl hydrolase [Roseateles aquatilis]OWQ92273.1 hypothetical protein CDN99_08035 [Roseateles aquatilis]